MQTLIIRLILYGMTLFTTLLPGGVNTLWAGDWPQILGPSRNGVAEEEHLAPRWPQGGPRTVWERPVGRGTAGASISGDRAMLFHRIENVEVLESLDLNTGRTLYQDVSPTNFVPQSGTEDGPLCVPVIAGERVVSYGAQGRLTCLDFRTGQRLWQRETHVDFKASEGEFGAGSTPIVIKDRVIVNVGGERTGAGIVAFSLQTGETVWQQTTDAASYSSPVAIEMEGQPFVVMQTRLFCQLLDPATGAILFRFPFGNRGNSWQGASPLVMQDRLLVTAAYDVGAVYGQFDLFGFQPIFQGKEPIATQYCTPIFLDGYVYFIDGRDDLPPADLKCVELASLRSRTRSNDQPRASVQTTALKWVEQNFGYGTLLLADGKLIALKNTGELQLIKPSPESYQVISRCRPLKGTVRALPALSYGKLLIRNGETLKCLNLAR